MQVQADQDQDLAQTQTAVNSTQTEAAANATTNTMSIQQQDFAQLLALNVKPGTIKLEPAKLATMVILF